MTRRSGPASSCRCAPALIAAGFLAARTVFFFGVALVGLQMAWQVSTLDTMDPEELPAPVPRQPRRGRRDLLALVTDTGLVVGRLKLSRCRADLQLARLNRPGFSSPSCWRRTTALSLANTRASSSAGSSCATASRGCTISAVGRKPSSSGPRAAPSSLGRQQRAGLDGFLLRSRRSRSRRARPSSPRCRSVCEQRPSVTDPAARGSASSSACGP